MSNDIKPVKVKSSKASKKTLSKRFDIFSDNMAMFVMISTFLICFFKFSNVFFYINFHIMI